MYHPTIADEETMGIEWRQHPSPSSQVTILGSLCAVAQRDSLQPTKNKPLAI